MTARPTPWVQLLLLPALFYFGAKLSLAFALLPKVLVMMWIPNSLLLAALFHYGTRRYGLFAVAVIIAEIAADYPTFTFLEAILFGSINLLEATIAYGLLQRWRFNPRFAAPLDLAKFVTAGPVIGALVSACAAAGIYRTFRVTETGYIEFVRIWWFSDGLGLLILTPLALSLWPPKPAAVESHHAPLRWYDALVMLGGFIVFFAFVSAYAGRFQDISIRPTLLLPPILYIAARFSLRTTTVTLVVVATMILYVTKNGQQPFGDLPIHETAVLTQEFIIIMSVTTLSIAALLSQLRTNARELEIRVSNRTAELRAANQRLKKLAVTDSLTGLLNRRALFRALRREIERAHRSRRELAVIMLDIDHFKQVNDRYGHGAGDAVLRHVAAVATKVIRNTDTMARYGGEEFVVVAPETDRAHALRLAERMREALRSTDVAVKRDELRVTASFGVTILSAEDKEPERILSRADDALYAAKAGGRDRVVADVPARVSA
ncbi:MAG: diguanylate cyclase [Sulfurifustaceae bacterium]